MKQIIGDDYPTYEDSVNATLEDIKRLKEVNKQLDLYKSIAKLEQENFELRHRLTCVADDIEIIDRHIASYKKSRKWFKQPSLNADGTIYADEAWHNVTNIQIACDLTDDSPLEWGSEFMEEAELDNLNKDLGEDPVFQGHLKHMELEAEFFNKYKAKNEK